MATKTSSGEKTAAKQQTAAATKPRVSAPATTTTTTTRTRGGTTGGTGRKPAAKSTPRLSSNKSQGPHFSLSVPEALQREIVGVLVFLLAALTAISLAGGSSSGLLAGWGNLLNTLFGWAAWLVPLALAAMALMLFVAGVLKINRLRWEMPLGVLMILLAVVGWLDLPITDEFDSAHPAEGGGLVGHVIGQVLSKIAGGLGAAVILLALAVIGAIMAFHISLGDLARGFGRAGQWLMNFFTAHREEEPEKDASDGGTALPQPQSRLRKAPAAPGDMQINANARKLADSAASAAAALEAASAGPLRIIGGATDIAKPPAAKDAPKTPPAPAINALTPLTAKEVKQLALPLPSASGYIWQLPRIDLLERSSDAEIDDDDLRRKAIKIEETLATFGVQARVREINSGPAVTQFALEPGEGMRVARIAALANDLALTLAAPSIRIEAPVPGMARVGIEVPNSAPALVGLRNIMESHSFEGSRARLKVPLGRDTHGQPVTVDLAKLPHLLIAGATGSGKSVAINSLIISLIMQYTPDELRFLMVDPKRVELSGFTASPTCCARSSPR